MAHTGHDGCGRNEENDEQREHERDGIDQSVALAAMSSSLSCRGSSFSLLFFDVGQLFLSASVSCDLQWSLNFGRLENVESLLCFLQVKTKRNLRFWRQWEWRESSTSLSTFQRVLLPQSSGRWRSLVIGAAGTTETSVNLYRTAQRHNPEESHL